MFLLLTTISPAENQLMHYPRSLSPLFPMSRTDCPLRSGPMAVTVHPWTDVYEPIYAWENIARVIGVTQAWTHVKPSCRGHSA
ncbi:hypothetical protein CesoFtcFv8_013243 [Champsocephalus esox]|uniref:Uncharacterized protein n=1 Tax=Champsocephalus esox TaxID=159716 RepID=A0AAN8GVH7_9TELE|nr:hypothetical protein CesoFtcFv8_013243 [Champsocephalus esox]